MATQLDTLQASLGAHTVAAARHVEELLEARQRTADTERRMRTSVGAWAERRMPYGDLVEGPADHVCGGKF
jgi:hypothetical protein